MSAGPSPLPLCTPSLPSSALSQTFSRRADLRGYGAQSTRFPSPSVPLGTHSLARATRPFPLLLAEGHLSTSPRGTSSCPRVDEGTRWNCAPARPPPVPPNPATRRRMRNPSHKSKALHQRTTTTTQAAAAAERTDRQRGREGGKQKKDSGLFNWMDKAAVAPDLVPFAILIGSVGRLL